MVRRLRQNLPHTWNEFHAIRLVQTVLHRHFNQFQLTCAERRY